MVLDSIGHEYESNDKGLVDEICVLQNAYHKFPPKEGMLKKYFLLQP